MEHFSENLYNFFYNFFEINIINSYFFAISKNSELFLDKQWLYFSNIISAILISFFIILLGIIFPNKAKIIKFLNLISFFYLLIFFYLISSEYIYDLNLINDIVYNTHLNFINDFFEQNHNLYVNFFFLIATLTTIIFFLSISDIFYLEENMKIEFTLLILYIYISALLLLSSLDFISIIILLECIAFSSYVLVGFERTNKFSTSSALKYLILAAIPSGFFILGISILYYNYGSFYQDYLELLIRSFDKIKIPTTDWYFIITDSAKNYSDFVESAQEQKKFINSFFKIYAIFLNNLLDSFNLAALVVWLNFLELFFIEEYIFLITEYEVDESLILISAPLTKTYNNIFMQYSTILEAVVVFFQTAAVMESSQTFSTEFINPTIAPKTVGITQNIFYIIDSLFDKKENNINKFFGFLSYYKYTRENFGLAGMDFLFNNLTYAGEIQKINIKYLFETASSSVASVDFINSMDFSKIDVFVRKSYNILKLFCEHCSFLSHNLNYFLDLSNSQNNFKLFIKFYNDLSLIFYKMPLYEIINYYYPETTFYLKKNFIIDFFWLYYDNIFLSTYIVIIFLLINLSFKITAAPFHFWAPSVYGGSPLPTITFLSVFSKLTIIFLFINLFLTVFEHLKFIWQPILFFLGIFSIIISIIGAFSEKLFKRFFIYSSIGHVGFMILGIAVLNYSGIQGSIDYLILYIISSFIVWFIVMHLTKKTTHLINFKGLSFNYPTLSLILIIALFSISGLPPMGGFFVKFEIFYSLLNSSQYFIGYFLFILTVFSFFYYLRLIKIIYFEENKLIKKNKNLNDIKLRIISILIFILPLYTLFVQEPFFYILKESIKISF